MNRIKRLAVITTHPIQYYAPLFRLLKQENLSFIIRVFYTQGQSQDVIYDKGFGISFKWDIPLLDGYDYTFVNNISRHPGTSSFRGIITPDLTKEIEEWHADAVLVVGWNFSSHLHAIRYFHGKIPVFFRGDSNLLDEPAGFSIKKIVRRLFLRWVYRHIDYALYTGKANKQYYLAHGVKKKQLLFAPHAVDNERFSGNNEAYENKAASWRTRLGIKENICVYLFAAKLIKKKDPEILIKAFIGLQQKDTALIIVGNGKLETELKERYKSQSGVFFISFQNQSMMPVVYRLGDIFVLPSKGPGETWGLAVNEAMASNRGVIVSDKCGCAADLVQTGKNGYVFYNGNINSLSDSMRSCLKNYQELGYYSYSIIKSWSYSAIINQLEDFFKKRQAINEES